MLKFFPIYVIIAIKFSKAFDIYVTLTGIRVTLSNSNIVRFSSASKAFVSANYNGV